MPEDHSIDFEFIDEDVRLEYVNSLVQDPPRGSAEANKWLDILGQLVHDPSPAVRLTVCQAVVRCVLLTNRFDDQTCKAMTDRGLSLVEVLTKDKDPEVFRLALRTIYTLGTNRELIELPKVEDPGNLHPSASVPELLQRVLASGDVAAEIERLASVPPITLTQLQVIFEVLGELSQHPSRDVRINVCRALVRCIRLYEQLDPARADDAFGYTAMVLEQMETEDDRAVRRYQQAAKLAIDSWLN